MKTSSCVLSSVLLLLSIPALETAAQSDNQGSNRGQLRSSSQRPPVVNNASRGGQRVTAPRQNRQHRQRSRNDSLRRLISPMGSATNVSPGFYRQLDAPQGSGYRHGPVIYPGPVLLPQPQVIYIRDEVQPAPQPQPRYQEPRYQEPRYQEPQPAPAPRQRAQANEPVPVYVVEPPRQRRYQEPPTPPAPPKPKSTEPQEVDLKIRPADAEVFLDDEYLGTAREVLASGLLSLIPGVYVLEVDHPDYRPQRLVFGVAGEEPMSVAIDLTAERPGRRARVK